MLRDLLRWWVGQLADSVPERWRHFGSTSGDALVITPIEPVAGGINAVAASLRRNGKEMPLGRFSLGGAGLAGLPQLNGRPTVLRLSESDVLLKTVTLPLAAERQLDQVLAFEMERETPFGTDEIYWSHVVTERDRQRGQLLVQLLLVPRASLAPLLGALADFGITPKRAEIAAGKNQNCHLPLDGHSGRLHDGATSARLLRWAAVALCASLAVAAVAIPFACQSWDLAELDQTIAAGRAAVAEAETLRGEIERLSGMANLIESERDKAGRPLVTLAALTRMLPDDTYINELQLQQHKLTISGRSAAASRLISALSAGNQLRNPTFAAPVTRIEATRSEIFTITAEVGP